MNAGAGANIHHIIGCQHGIFVVLHHDQGVSQIPQPLQGCQQLVIIPLVQADGGLVQHIQHAHQRRADLGGQTNALAFAAGQGSAGTGQGQILQTNILEEFQPGADLLENQIGDLLFLLCQLQTVDEIQCIIDGKLGEFRDVFSANSDCQDLFFQSSATAGRTGDGTHALLNILFGRVGGKAIHISALHIRDDTLKGPGFMLVALPGKAHVQHIGSGTVKDHFSGRFGQIFPGGIQRPAVFFTHSPHIGAGNAVFIQCLETGGLQRALIQR